MFTETKKPGQAVYTSLHKILQIRYLTESTFVLRFDRNNMEFRSGQHINVGLEGELNQREYTIYSGENDDYLEILVREIPVGSVSSQLKQGTRGQLLQVNGPFGSFRLEKFNMFSGRLIFVASGTGISPFHSFIRSYPGIDYTLLHGVRYRSEAYDSHEYDPRRYLLCTSQEARGRQRGRVTDFLKSFPVYPDMLFYLCGNSNMIYDTEQILRSKGIPGENIFTEIYF